MIKDEMLSSQRVFFIKIFRASTAFLGEHSSLRSARRVRHHTPDGIERFESGHPMNDCGFIR